MFERFRKPEYLLILLAAAGSFAFASWHTLLNNYAVETAGFTGVEIGILQSLREVPGFLAFTTIFVLLILREQTFALLSIALLGLGVSLTGVLNSEYGLYFTTVLMSIGFHYYFTLQQSLTLQWVDKGRSPLVMGRQSSARSVASIIVFAGIWLGMEQMGMDYAWLYGISGGVAVLVSILAWQWFPAFTHKEPQHKHLVLRKRYWLYYALVFMSGARRQIFIVFAGFLMVEKFGYSASDIALLFLINHVINTPLAPRIGRLISSWGERRVLGIEYLGLIVIFISYAFVEQGWLAAMLYVLDHLFFAMAIGINSYFHKIAEPKDIASTAGVSFTINHIAAVVIPVLFGIIWINSPSAVFIMGAVMAAISFSLSRLIPDKPEIGNEVTQRGVTVYSAGSP
ncbi:MAG: MFS transporter [Sedimenticola sp.]|nr:MAG: MFS transporter [Sedimenticola sp.]